MPTLGSASVAVGLTSIPSRVRRGLFPTLASLARQTLLPTVIVLTVPQKNMRGILAGPATDAALQRLRQWWQEEQGSPVPLVVHQPPDDLGPIMKYVGTAEALGPHTLATLDGVVIVDDDQVYSDTLVQALAARHGAQHPPAVLSMQTRLQRVHPKLLSVFGFGGVWVPAPVLAKLAVQVRAEVSRRSSKALPLFAAVNDDVFAAILIHKQHVPIVDVTGAVETPVPAFGDGHGTLDGQEGSRATGSTTTHTHALSGGSASVKHLQIAQCHWAYNQPFTAVTVIGLVVAAVAVLGCAGVAAAAAALAFQQKKS